MSSDEWIPARDWRLLHTSLPERVVSCKYPIWKQNCIATHVCMADWLPDCLAGCLAVCLSDWLTDLRLVCPTPWLLTCIMRPAHVQPFGDINTDCGLGNIRGKHCRMRLAKYFWDSRAFSSSSSSSSSSFSSSSAFLTEHAILLVLPNFVPMWCCVVDRTFKSNY